MCVCPHCCFFSVAALSEAVPLSSLSHIIITQLDPKSIPTLQLLLSKVKEAGPAVKPTLVLSNPALRLLQSTMGKSHALTTLDST